MGDRIFHGEAAGGTCTGCHGADAKGSPQATPWYRVLCWPMRKPQASLSMCGCALKASLATFPARSIIRAKPAVVKGE